ncbi:MAG: hypothetical protein S4CHLAM81_12620 [Chlamydiales bacterium]|nr:hypothetical protein [Chlamydiales bacterium]MCH9636037.1 hypothetical protein [Chlamydiales bacterium]MCH9703608.1 ester cyclase [Chlamydiota bacterium]
MNKKIIEKYTTDVWKNKRLEAINETFAEDAIIHSPLNLSDMKTIVQRWQKALPDLQVEHHHLLEDGEMITSHWSATSQKAKYSGVTLYRMRDHKIVEYWAYVDLRNLPELDL